MAEKIENSSEIILSAEKIVKKYGAVKALNNVSIELKSGKITGLIGENGAGKTTLIRILSGVMQPDEGVVRLTGKSMYPNPEVCRNNIGYLPEGNPLPGHLRVSEFISFMASMKNATNDNINEIINLMDLEIVKNKFISTLSSGFKQRTGLAGTFLGWPPVIILDEPSRGLDPVQTDSLREIIRTAAKKSCILISSHGLDELERITEDFLYIKDGRIIFSGNLPENTTLVDFFHRQNRSDGI
ncbi:ABC transporter ATP-binding protein [Myxococcota bacterium]|nr:ABC transporter ATP-binding protein [Myxococcota bacterium]MBU1379554.1 ABC transporter ATP-binding protein [Myxococcota bacterium]MBU1495272.1 ABC transporter ATP-binding protein [Myxococcota bacterium]